MRRPRARRAEFLRRFFLHVLPRGFVRIRHFGFLANRRRQTRLPLCRELLCDAGPLESATSGAPAPAQSFWICPDCGGPMIIVERFAATFEHVRPPAAQRVEAK